MPSEIRTCSKCGAAKSITEFRESKPGYRRRVCNECMDAHATKWRQENAERRRQWDKERYVRVRDVQIKRAKAWNKRHPERKKQNSDSHYRRLKHAAVMAYGGYRCNCCGETEHTFLSIDHVHNDGYKHKGPHGRRYVGLSLFSWLKKNDYPDGFQVLCHNCNIGKHLNDGVCPHQVDSARPIDSPHDRAR